MTPSVRLMLVTLLILTALPRAHSARAQEPTEPGADVVGSPTVTMPATEQPNHKIYLPLVTVGNPLTATVAEWPEDDSEDPAIGTPEEAPWPEEVPTVDSSADSDVDSNAEDTPVEVNDLVLAAVTPDTAGTIDSTEDYKALGYPDARKIVRNSQGDLYITYRKKVNGRYRIFVAASTDQGQRWQVLNGGSPVETVGDYTQRVPAIAIDNEDRLHLVWYGNDAANGNADNTSDEREIKYMRSSSTTARGAPGELTWSPWTNLYDGRGYSGGRLWQEHPTIYVNGTNVYVVWESNETANGRIKFIRSTDDGDSWHAVVDIQPSNRIFFSRPTLMVSYAGEQRYLYLVAYGTKRGVARLFWTRSADNGDSWEQWQPVAAGKSDQRHASLARDDAGRLHIVWRQVKKGSTILRYRVYDPEKRQSRGGWVSGPKTIASVRNHCLFFPSIAVSGKNSSSDPEENDRVWVTWTQSDDCTSVPNDDPVAGQIYLTSQDVNGKWGKPQAVTAAGRHLYATLRRANSPSSTAGNVDLIWLDATQSPVDATTGEPTCADGSCLIKHVALGQW